MYCKIETLGRGACSVVYLYVFIFAMMITFFAPQAMSTDYYVATNGSDSNNGSIDHPWLSLNHAIEVAGAGDAILMRAGTYTTNEVWIRGDRGMGGANGQFLTIKNYPGETVSVGGSRRIIIDNASYLRIEGLELRPTYRISGGGVGIQIVNNRFVGSQADYGVIEMVGDEILIEGNHLEITGGGDTQDHGIYLHYGKNIIIRNNFISGASGYGIHIYDEDKGTGEIKRYENILVEDNYIVNSRERAGIMIGAHDATVEMDGITIRNNVIANNNYPGIFIKYEPSSNVSIFNNIFYGNTDGIYILTGINKLTVRNNIFDANGEGHIYISGSVSNATVSNNLYSQPESIGSGLTDSKPCYGDPLFVDADEGDFSLQKGSPAIDAGIDVGMPYTGNAPDIGAFEYGMEAVAVENNGMLPETINLLQNYPNPFNPTTEIDYSLPCDADVELLIFDVTGRHVKTLVRDRESSGFKTVKWDGTDENNRKVTSGMYLYQLKAGEISVVKRMMLVR